MSTTRKTSKKNATPATTPKTTTKDTPTTTPPSTQVPDVGPGSTGVPHHRTITEATLWTALGDYPGFTSAELAGAAEIGTSTASRILAGWAADGYARNEPDPDNPRAARRWFATAAYQDATSAPNLGPEHIPAPDPEMASEPESDDVPPSADADTTTQDADAVSDPASASTDTDSTDSTDPVSDRLGSGELRKQVEQYLAAHPSKEFTPHQIGKMLKRSSGAVHNALVTLTTTEIAKQTSDKPKKFALAGD